MTDDFRSQRYRIFRGRADYNPGGVYHHFTHGWEYVPVHPFGDEPDSLARLGIQPKDCRSADAWWGIAGDATLLESAVVGATSWSAGLFAKRAPYENDEQRIYLVAIFDAPYVTRMAIEAAMVRFAEAGFPRASLFQLEPGDKPVRLPIERAG